MIDWNTDNETVHNLVVGYLSQRGGDEYQKITEVLKRGLCQLKWEADARRNRLKQWVPDGRITYVLVLLVRPADMHLFEDESSPYPELLHNAFLDLLSEREPQIRLAFKALVSLPNEGAGLNNGFFKTEMTITHDELRFRSHAEIAIYNELKRRNVLFFPNPAAVFGSATNPDMVQKREPDFLICDNGKWGILEVNGEPYHSGPVTTAKDHERFRLFQRHGLFFTQAYDANPCRNDPAKVVGDFLKLLEKSR